MRDSGGVMKDLKSNLEELEKADRLGRLPRTIANNLQRLRESLDLIGMSQGELTKEGILSAHEEIIAALDELVENFKA